MVAKKAALGLAAGMGLLVLSNVALADDTNGAKNFIADVHRKVIEVSFVYDSAARRKIFANMVHEYLVEGCCPRLWATIGLAPRMNSGTP
ncbi:MAG: hypothetical protein R3E60_05405 [Alphaproteobacteria bacterium]